MEYDYHRAEEKRSELKDVAASILREFNSKRSETLAGKIIDHFVRITPPEQAEEHIKFITVWDRVGMWGGESII